MQDSRGLRVYDLGCGVQWFEFRVWGPGTMPQGFEFRVQGLVFRTGGSGLRVWSQGCRIQV